MDGAPSEAFLRRLMEKLRCNACGQRYQRDDITVLGAKDDLWFLGLSCPHCRSSGLVAAIVSQAPPAIDDCSAEERRKLRHWPPLSLDDVLDMHNWLKEFDSDFARLFAPSTSQNE